MTRFARYDRGLAVLDFAEGAVLGFGIAPAVETSEGYVRATAYLARDGLLEYGDGRKSWMEYRPRSELVRTSHEWADKPGTWEHPADMVNAVTWQGVAVGHVVSSWIEDIDGVAYLAAEILIQDAETVRQLRQGENREISIGFWANVVETEDGRSADGTQCAAVQTNLAPNHYAHVDQGRAGAACRVFLDAAGAVVHDCLVATRKDTTGAPTETVEQPLPDGSIALIPTAVAAWIMTLEQQVETLTAAAATEAPAEEAAPPAAAPPVEPGDEPEEDAPPETPPAVAPQAAAPEENEETDEEEPDPMADKKDSVAIDLKIVRKVVADHFKDLAAVVDDMNAEQLRPLFDTAIAKRAEAPKADDAGQTEVADQGNPFEKPTPTGTARGDQAYAPVAGYLAGLGY